MPGRASLHLPSGVGRVGKQQAGSLLSWRTAGLEGSVHAMRAGWQWHHPAGVEIGSSTGTHLLVGGVINRALRIAHARRHHAWHTLRAGAATAGCASESVTCGPNLVPARQQGNCAPVLPSTVQHPRTAHASTNARTSNASWTLQKQPPASVASCSVLLPKLAGGHWACN